MGASHRAGPRVAPARPGDLDVGAPVSQRWRERRATFRPRGEGFDASVYGVEPLDRDTEARDFVERHHYSGSYPAARLRVGLYRRRAWVRPELVGVAVFSVGVQPAAVTSWSGEAPAAGLDLGRFVLLDDVEFNAETWFLARAFRLLAATLPDVRVVLSYSDPLARVTDAGALVTPGHVGTIYQAKGASYRGQTRASWIHLDRHGRTISPRSLAKIRLGERGWESAARGLVERGADHRQFGEEPQAWLARVLPNFRRVRHPGQHVYLFAPTGTAAGLPASLAYPKRGAA